MLLSSCQEEDPCPRCFEDIVTCKVNGKEWRSNCISNDPLFGCSSINCYYYIKDNFGLDFSASSDNNNTAINLDQNTGNGSAKLGLNNIEQNEVFYINRNFTNQNDCSRLKNLDINYRNYFEIKSIDSINFIITGAFEFRVYNNCGDTSTITNGYFKTKFIF